MGGVGKTTLLTEINNKLSKGAHGFDNIIWVRVSENSSVENIQHEIGRKIGYTTTWANRSQVEKADNIFTVLSKKRFVLLLDDIRMKFDLKDVGVPLLNKQTMSKVVFTTRSWEVCCQMEAHRKVKVECLGTAEAWELFKSKVGDDILNRNHSILKLAELVAKECEGLPLALVVIGKAMASKKAEEWSGELSVLKENAARFAGCKDEIFGLLRLNYDNLPTDQAKNCFLYCSLFPGVFHIAKEKLINYWFGEGLVEDPSITHNKIGVGSEGQSIIGTLINACLLEDDGNGGVKMHEVIRDMALWLACDCGKKRIFFVQAHAELTEVPSGIPEVEVERISLAGNSIKSLPDMSSCHNLLTLFLNDNLLNMISPGFFKSMRGLRVLDLSGNEGITELPNEISLLVSIQYLNLAGTSITVLQEELGGLIRLKYLDLTYTYYLRKFPARLLLSFQSLRVLKMFECDSSILIEENSARNCDPLMKWIYQASEPNVHKTLVSLTIRNSHFLELFISGSAYIWINRLGFLHTMIELHSFLLSICKANPERLEITDCEFQRSPSSIYLTMQDLKYMWNLRSVFIARCSSIQNLTWLLFAYDLKFLLVAHCKDIQEILGEEENVADKDYFKNVIDPFDSLKDLYLIELPQLHSVTSTNKKFRSLRYIGVEGCPKLTKLSVNSETEVRIQGSEDWWDGLPDKPTATACITDSNKKDNQRPASASSSTTYPDAYLPYFKSFY